MSSDAATFLVVGVIVLALGSLGLVVSATYLGIWLQKYSPGVRAAVRVLGFLFSSGWVLFGAAFIFIGSWVLIARG